MDTYLINLKRRPDRLSEVSRKMAELGLPFKIFRAVDGHDDDAKLPDLNRHLFVINQSSPCAVKLLAQPRTSPFGGSFLKQTKNMH